jgi:hypothetical protein
MTSHPNGDTRMSELNLLVSDIPLESKTYASFAPHFLWIDYQAESSDEIFTYLLESEEFGDNPTLYETLALIFHSLQQLGGSLTLSDHELRAVTLRDCGGLTPLQDDTIVAYNGGFYRLGHLLQEYNLKGDNPDVFEPDVSEDEVKDYVEVWERHLF